MKPEFVNIFTDDDRDREVAAEGSTVVHFVSSQGRPWAAGDLSDSLEEMELYFKPPQGDEHIFINNQHEGEDRVKVMEHYLNEIMFNEEEGDLRHEMFVLRALAVRFFQDFKDVLGTIGFFDSGVQLAIHLNDYAQRHNLTAENLAAISGYALFNDELCSRLELMLNDDNLPIELREVFLESERLASIVNQTESVQAKIEAARRRVKEVVEISISTLHEEKNGIPKLYDE